MYDTNVCPVVDVLFIDARFELKELIGTERHDHEGIVTKEHPADTFIEETGDGSLSVIIVKLVNALNLYVTLGTNCIISFTEEFGIYFLSDPLTYASTEEMNLSYWLMFTGIELTNVKMLYFPGLFPCISILINYVCK